MQLRLQCRSCVSGSSAHAPLHGLCARCPTACVRLCLRAPDARPRLPGSSMSWSYAARRPLAPRPGAAAAGAAPRRGGAPQPPDAAAAAAALLAPLLAALEAAGAAGAACAGRACAALHARRRLRAPDVAAGLQRVIAGLGAPPHWRTGSCTAWRGLVAASRAVWEHRPGQHSTDTEQKRRSRCSPSLQHAEAQSRASVLTFAWSTCKARGMRGPCGRAHDSLHHMLSLTGIC